MEKEKSTLNIMRHGTYYDGGKGELPDDSKRLNEKGIQEVQASAEKLAELIGPDEEVAIWTSPLPRTQHTAEIVRETLLAKNKKFHREDRFPEPRINVFKELAEIKNYDPALFRSLLKGGNVQYAGKSFFIDKNQTNPRNLSTLDYLAQEEIGRIDPEVKKQWPPEFVEKIDSVESYADTSQRIARIIARLEKLQDKKYRIILVTHKGLTSFLVKNITKGEKEGLDPGEFIDVAI